LKARQPNGFDRWPGRQKHFIDFEQIRRFLRDDANQFLVQDSLAEVEGCGELGDGRGIKAQQAAQ
jgi:hypothetical protein